MKCVTYLSNNPYKVWIRSCANVSPFTYYTTTVCGVDTNYIVTNKAHMNTHVYTMYTHEDTHVYTMYTHEDTHVYTMYTHGDTRVYTMYTHGDTHVYTMHCTHIRI